MIKSLLTKTAYVGTKLLKLKLSKMDLNNDDIVTLICETISFNKNMISLDLSYGKLTPGHLAKIAKTLADKAKCLRSLNLSNNMLDFDVNNYENMENS